MKLFDALISALFEFYFFKSIFPRFSYFFIKLCVRKARVKNVINIDISFILDPFSSRSTNFARFVTQCVHYDLISFI